MIGAFKLLLFWLRAHNIKDGNVRVVFEFADQDTAGRFATILMQEMHDKGMDGPKANTEHYTGKIWGIPYKLDVPQYRSQKYYDSRWEDYAKQSYYEQVLKDKTMLNNHYYDVYRHNQYVANLIKKSGT